MNKDSNISKPAKNTCLGFFEILASMLIVFIHSPFPGITGELVEGLARFAVPLFFTISGFYLFKDEMTVKDLRIKLKTRIFRIGKIAVFSFILYFIVLGAQAIISNTLSNWLIETFNISALVELILFNNPLLMVSNWFLVALLFCYFIIYLFPSAFINNKILIKIIVSFLPIWVVVRLIMLILKIEVGNYLLSDPLFYRNWYAVGLPFVCFGILLKQKEEKLKTVSLKVIIIGLIIAIIEMVIANYLFIHLLGDSIAYYCGSVIVVFFIMCLTIQKPTLFSKNILVNVQGNWTMQLYIFHPAVIGIIQLLFVTLKIDQIAIVMWIEPLIVLTLSALLAIGVNSIIVKTKLKKR